LVVKLNVQVGADFQKDADEDEKLVLAFVDEESPEGVAVLRLLKRLVNMNSQYAGQLQIVLIDPDEFPLMIDEWEKMFDIEIEAGPVLGLADISEVSSHLPSPVNLLLTCFPERGSVV